MSFCIRIIYIRKTGGRGGIRTHGRIAPTPDFESGAFNHSATLPERAHLFLTNTGREQAHSSRGQTTRSKLQTARHASQRLLLAGFARAADSLPRFPQQDLLWPVIMVVVMRRSPQKICFQQREYHMQSARRIRKPIRCKHGSGQLNAPGCPRWPPGNPKTPVVRFAKCWTKPAARRKTCP
jgi:hypothetical protein